MVHIIKSQEPIREIFVLTPRQIIQARLRKQKIHIEQMYAGSYLLFGSAFKIEGYKIILKNQILSNVTISIYYELKSEN